MDACDVLVIGGGPAGSACAAGLRRRGIDVLVMDRRSPARDKVFGGWITPQVVDELRLDLDEYAEGRVLQPITGFRAGMIGDDDDTETHYGRPVSYGIRRYEFDDYLLARSGARRRLGEAAETFERRDDAWIVNGDVQAPLLVGAGGHFCPVARRLGARRRDDAPVVTAQEVEFEIPPEDRKLVSVSATVPELFFCRDLAGYGWCFRQGNFLNLGLGRVGGEPVGEHVADLVVFLRRRGKVACDIPTRMHGQAYQLFDRVEPVLFDEGVLLVGDAAGLAYPHSGGGMRPAVESGLMAAETILEARGDYARENLECYERRIHLRFGSPQRRQFIGRLPTGWLAVLARRVLRSPSFVDQQEPELAIH